MHNIPAEAHIRALTNSDRGHIAAMRSSIPFCLCVVSTIAQAQVEPQDTLRGIDLPDAQVMGTRPDMSRLAPVQGTYLFAGRKSEVIAL
ncbi:MAG: hypothetical protein KA230_12885, partial [Flavobacteriales bacterium]|nr:hypothetical protein [Flavobacteriales bacterium]